MALSTSDYRTRLIVMKLLGYVHDNFEKSFVHGRYITPGTVFRCDATGNSDSGDVTHATFYSLPYLAIERLSQSGSDNISSGNCHPPKTLLQFMFDHVSTEERDTNQTFTRFYGPEKNHCLYVFQLWVLVINSSTSLHSC